MVQVVQVIIGTEYMKVRKVMKLHGANFLLSTKNTHKKSSVEPKDEKGKGDVVSLNTMEGGMNM